MYKKWVTYILVAFILNTSCLILYTGFAEAVVMSSPDYILEGEIAAPVDDLKKPVTPYNLDRAGSLTFSVSSDRVDFGILSPANPITRTNTLSVSSQESFSIMAVQDRPLTSETNDFIPDTTCDIGACTPYVNAPWTSILTYGFGYSTSQTDEYKQFISANKDKQPISILKGFGEPFSRVITYKVNVSNTQSKGAYTNTVTLIAVPNF